MTQVQNRTVNGGGGQLAGSKRHADDSNFNDEQRFAKRFHLLSIGSSQPNGTSNNYRPVATAAGAHRPSSHAKPIEPNGLGEDELMQVDDTRDRVYVHNLDDELADIEEEEQKLVFLPDIEKQMSKIPKQVLLGRRGSEHENQEIVLYSVPKSLTVEEGQDSVRKAIIEARQRAREKAVEDARHEDMIRKYDHSEHNVTMETAHGYSAGWDEEPDPDAMELG